MRRAVRTRPRNQAILQVEKIPAPIKGWWDQDAVADAPPGSALVMDNVFCQSDAVRIRKGTDDHATGCDDDVETLMTYYSGTASKMFAATANGSVYDVTSAGAVGAAVVSGLTNGRLEYINYATGAGQYLAFVNGADSYRNYDGSTWTTPTITGVSSSNLSHIFQRRTRRLAGISRLTVSLGR
jgi:hypothetical protein